MIDPSPDELRFEFDHSAIDRLLRSYADVVNRRAWDDLADLFLPDAVVELDLVDREPLRFDGPREFAAFIGPAVARFDFFEFVILNAHTELAVHDDVDQATARVFMCEIRHHRDEGFSTAYGLYRDSYARTASGWRFADRRYRSLARAPEGPVFGLPPA